MILSIHQPSYWPWFGLLDKMAKCDVFVILDHVQLNKDSYQRRNIFSAHGKQAYLTIPIHYNLGVKINEAKIRDVEFSAKHYRVLKDWYGKHPFFSDIDRWIRPIYDRRYEYLKDIVLQTMYASLEAFGITCRIVLSSDLQVLGVKSELVLNICKALDADVYLSGKGAREYFNDEHYQSFKEAKIELMFQKFEHPQYPQYHAGEFIPGLGCLDYLFNCGLQESKNFIKKVQEGG